MGGLSSGRRLPELKDVPLHRLEEMQWGLKEAPSDFDYKGKFPMNTREIVHNFGQFDVSQSVTKNFIVTNDGKDITIHDLLQTHHETRENYVKKTNAQNAADLEKLNAQFAADVKGSRFEGERKWYVKNSSTPKFESALHELLNEKSKTELVNMRVTDRKSRGYRPLNHFAEFRDYLQKDLPKKPSKSPTTTSTRRPRTSVSNSGRISTGRSSPRTSKTTRAITSPKASRRPSSLRGSNASVKATRIREVNAKRESHRRSISRSDSTASVQILPISTIPKRKKRWYIKGKNETTIPKQKQEGFSEPELKEIMEKHDVTGWKVGFTQENGKQSLDEQKREIEYRLMRTCPQFSTEYDNRIRKLNAKPKRKSAMDKLGEMDEDARSQLVEGGSTAEIEEWKAKREYAQNFEKELRDEERRKRDEANKIRLSLTNQKSRLND